MKKIFYISLIVLGQLFVGCSGFLVENPTTKLDQSSAYSTVETANAVLTGAYAAMASYDYFGYRYMHILSATSGAWVSTRANEIPFTSLQIQSNDAAVEKLYTAQYNAIGVTNDIIWNLPKSNINETSKNTILGQAYLLRAVNYFNLVRQFGKLSLVTKPVQNFEEAHYPRTDVSIVYDTIIKDLNRAYDLLPEKGGNALGRPHKNAAKAVLAKVYLTMAGNDAASPYWQNAYDAAKTVYDSKTYSLITPFSTVFDIKNKNNAESILEFQFSATIQPLQLTQVLLPKGVDLLPNASASLNQTGKTRPCKDTYDLFTTTYPGDPRIDATFLHDTYFNKIQNKLINIYPQTKKTTGANADDIEYAFVRKYVDPSFETGSSCNFIYYRYADLLLVLAEAANELGKTSEAVGYVNELLTRARVKSDGTIAASPLDWDHGLSKEDVRAKLFTERQIELCGEADEWYTFRRRGFDYLKSIIDRHNTRLTKLTGYPTLAKYVYSYPATDEDVKRNLLLPFPLTEINSNININQEDQNYGY